MKLGKLVSTLESNDSNATEVPEALLTEEEQKESVFPDISIPDELSFSHLKRANDTAHTNSDIAISSRSLLKSNLESLRAEGEVTPLTATAIGAQIRSIYSVFPDTKQQDIEFLDNIIPSNTPTVVQMTTESMEKTMHSLDSIVVNSLAAASNIIAFLNKNVDLGKIQKDLINSKTLTDRSERVPVEGVQEYNLVDHNEIFPKILKAVEAGYDPDEITEAFEADLPNEDHIPDTAVISIQRGIQKLPLTRTREVTGKDIGHLTDFVKATSAVQEYTATILMAVTESLSDGETGGDKLMASAETINAAINQFIESTATLASNPVNKESDPGGSGNDVRAEFCVMPDGRKVILFKNGSVEFPQIAAERTFGYIVPSQISDTTTACIETLLPAMSSLKKHIDAVSKLSKEAAEVIVPNLNSETNVAGDAFSKAITRMFTVVKFSNSMATLAAESVVDTCGAVLDIARGVGILVET